MPDNAIYYELAYLSTAAILVGYIASIFWRQRTVRARLLAERSVEGR